MHAGWNNHGVEMLLQQQLQLQRNHHRRPVVKNATTTTTTTIINETITCFRKSIYKLREVLLHNIPSK